MQIHEVDKSNPVVTILILCVIWDWVSMYHILYNVHGTTVYVKICTVYSHSHTRLQIYAILCLVSLQFWHSGWLQNGSLCDSVFHCGRFDRSPRIQCNHKACNVWDFCGWRLLESPLHHPNDRQGLCQPTQRKRCLRSTCWLPCPLGQEPHHWPTLGTHFDTQHAER